MKQGYREAAYKTQVRLTLNIKNVIFLQELAKQENISISAMVDKLIKEKSKNI